jgi:hypothetical protein
MRNKGIVLLLAIPSVAVLTLSAVGRLDGGIKVGHQDFDRIEIQLNTFTQSTQSEISLDMADDGAVVAAWDSRRQDHGTYGVFARWVDALGRPRGPEEQVNVERRSMQQKPVVSLGADGGAWFAWQSLQQDGESGAIIGRLAGDEQIVNATTAGDQSRVVVDRLADGRLVAAWQTAGGQPLQSRIALRLLDDTGVPCSDEIVLDVPEGSQDQLPCVAAGGRGGFVLAWARTEEGNHPAGIQAMRFDSQAAPIGAPLQVSRPGRAAIEPSLAVDGSGNFAVAWLEYDDKTEYDVMVRRYRADGSALAQPTPVSADPAGWQSGAALSMASDGRLLVAWNTSRDGGLESDIYARLFDAAGNPESGDFLVNGRTEGSQALAAGTGVRRAALGEDGRMAFAWQGDSGNGDESAANLTILVPARPGLAGDLASGLRKGGELLASVIRDETTYLDRTAEPYIPPSFDATQRGPLLDPDSRVVGERQVGFTAFTNTGWTPPDPHMAAGPAHVMGIVNGGIVVYEKDGTLVWQDDISDAGGFWGPVGATNFVFDPEVIFDPYSNRFMAMANERSADNRSMFLLGISHTSDPSNQAAWYKYRFDVTALAGNDTDSPNLAVDRDAIYITADFFTGGQKYLIYIIDKSSVIDGGAAVTTNFLHTGSQSFGIPAMYSDDAPTMYMIEHFEADPSNTVRLWAINDPLGTPSLTSFTLSVPTYYRPANLRSQGTAVQQIAFDSRFWSCMYRNGSLWAAQHMSLSNSPRVTASRWYEISMNGWPQSGSDPTLRQSGTVAPTDVFCSFNSIGVDDSGNAVMVFARSSVNEFFSISRTYRFAGDPLGTMSPPEVVKQSNFAYGVDRWGDYSAVVADPVDLGHFWMHHEYTPGSGSWHTWMASEVISPPGSYLTLSDTQVSDDDLGQSHGNADGNLNPSETIELWVTVRNIGQASSTNVSGALSIDGGQVTIVDGNGTWNDIPAGGEGQSLTPFVFEISGSVTHGEILPFLLTMTDDLGTREIDLSLTVDAPVLAYNSHAYDDATHGNGNGIVEPGEVLVLSVELANPGGQGAEDVTAVLSSSNPNVVIIDETGHSDLIAAGGQGVLDPPYRVAVLSSAIDGELLNFDLAVSTAAGYATNASFTQRVGSYFFDDVEEDGSWSLASPGDNATAGAWVRVDPIGTLQNGNPCQPEDDHTPAPGTMCFVTGQGPDGGVAGQGDIDGGTTTLTTPTFDLSEVAEPTVSYWSWYTNHLGSNPNADVWLVQISSNGGGSWVDLENTTASHNSWEQRSFAVGDYVTPTDQIVVRFVASDLGLASLVEAAVDDFSISGQAGVVEVAEVLPTTGVRLELARPNPMRDHTTLSFTLPAKGQVRLRILGADGRLVRTLVDAALPAGVHRAQWDGRAAGGRPVSSGIFFAELSCGEQVRTRRLVVLR